MARRVRIPYAAAASAALLLLLAAPAPPAAAQVGGVADVVAGADRSRRVDGGGSATAFSLRLPPGAACPGDSAEESYRVQSYMVPATVDPASIRYDGLGPVPFAFGEWATFRQTLYDTSTASFASAQTAEAARPGGPGPVVNLPAFSFGVYQPGDLPPGRYRIGIACSLFNETVSYWGAELVFVDEPDDAPAQVAWRVVGAPDRAPATRGWPAVAAGAAAAVVLTAVRMRRRTPRPATTPLEDR